MLQAPNRWKNKRPSCSGRFMVRPPQVEEHGGLVRVAPAHGGVNDDVQVVEAEAPLKWCIKMWGGPFSRKLGVCVLGIFSKGKRTFSGVEKIFFFFFYCPYGTSRHFGPFARNRNLATCGIKSRDFSMTFGLLTFNLKIPP
jgi:hypothetical protein